MVETSDNDELLADLFRHPGWPILTQRLKERKAKDTQSLALGILAVTTPLNQREIDETRGFWRGADYLLRETSNAAKALERPTKEGEPV